MTPTKEMIETRAREMFHEQHVREGDPAFAIEPERNELQEGGYLSAAMSELMRSAGWQTLETHDKKSEKEQEKEESENFAEILDVEALLRSGTVVLGGSGCGKSTLAKAIVRKLSEKGVTSYIVDASKTWSSEPYDIVEVFRNCKTYQWRTRNTVFDTATLTISERVIFVNTLATTLLADRIDGANNRPEVLVMEEAETYLSNNSLRSKAFEGLLTYIAVGRNFNARFIAISQCASMIDKLVLKLSEERFFGRLSEPNDLRYCKAILNKESVEQLKSLQVGQFLCENKGKIQRFKLETEKPHGLNFVYQYSPFLSTETFI